jgi:hypothetical protein
MIVSIVKSNISFTEVEHSNIPVLDISVKVPPIKEYPAALGSIEE